MKANFNFPYTALTSKKRVMLLMLLGAIALPSCAQVPASRSGSQEMMVAKSEMGAQSMAEPAPMADNMAMPSGSLQANVAQAQPTVPQAPRQLIKRATLTVEVEAIDKSIQAVSDLVKQKQGDLLNFQDNKPQNSRSRHTVSMELRVPQQQLENTINAIAELGTVQNRSITAEDVTEQLVDNDARVKNLRKSEETVLKIMERSGSVGDVLNAARELSNIREQIERLEATQKNLQDRVAYSTIYLNLEAPVSAAEVPNKPLGKEIQETWGNATEAVGEMTVGLMKFMIYLLVFSPFLLLLGAGGFWIYNKANKQKSNESRVNP